MDALPRLHGRQRQGQESALPLLRVYALAKISDFVAEADWEGINVQQCDIGPVVDNHGGSCLLHQG